MKTHKKLIISCFAVLAFAVLAGNANAATLSQSSISLTVGQSSTVYAYNTSSSLYLLTNSNPSIATVSMNGSTSVIVYGVSIGSTSATICDSISGCSVLYITVSGYNGYNNGTNGLGLNLSNLTLPIGSSATVSPSNYYNNTTGLYVLSNSNPLVASTSLSSAISGCYGTNLYSIITGQPCNSTIAYPYNTSYIPGCYGTSQYSITSGQPCYGGSNSGSGSVVITAISTGSDTITICQSNASTCNTLNITVGNYSALNSSYYNSYNNSGIPTVYSSSSAN